VKKLAFALTIAASLAVASGSAHANAAGYVCTVNYQPSPVYGYGDYGFIMFTLYSQPYCAGSSQGTFWAFTKGATVNTDVRSLYSEAGLLALDQTLNQALVYGRFVDVFSTYGADWLAQSVRLWAAH